MRISAAVVVLLCFIGCLLAADNKISSPFGIKQLSKLARSSPIIHLNSDDYTKLIVDAPRNYSTLVLFTATSPKYNCGHCSKVADEFAKLGEWYTNHFDLSSKEFLDKPIFLAQCEPDHCAEAFKIHEFTTVPHFVYVPPSTRKLENKIRDEDMFRVSTRGDTSCESIAEYIKQKSGIEIPEFVSLQERLTPIFALAVLGFVLFKVLQRFRSKVFEPLTWFGLAMVGYAVVMAGVSYNLIRSPPFAEMNQQGKMVLISPQARSQYVVEGYIIGVLFTATGLLIVGLTDWVPLKAPKKFRRIFFWVQATGLFMCLLLINNIFYMKYRMSAFRLHSWAMFV